MTPGDRLHREQLQQHYAPKKVGISVVFIIVWGASALTLAAAALWAALNMHS